MVLDRGPVLVRDPDRGFVERALRVAAGARQRLEAEAPLRRFIGGMPGASEIGGVRVGLVLDPQEGCRVVRDVGVLCDHERDRLAAVDDPVVMEGPQRRAGRSDVVPVT